MPATTPACGRHSGCSSAELGVDHLVGSQAGSSLLTTNCAEPPPPSTPWQFAHSSDFVLS